MLFRSHFGFYPFRWSAGWEREAARLCFDGSFEGSPSQPARLAPVLERLVFPRARAEYVEWLRSLAACSDLRLLISAHYNAPQPIRADAITAYAEALIANEWAPSQGPWQTLAAIDQTLLRLGVVPGEAQTT